MKRRFASAVFALVVGLALGGTIAFYGFFAPASVTVSAVTVDPTPDMEETMFEFGAERGGLLVDTECYAAAPVTACIAVYRTSSGTKSIGWVFKKTTEGLRSY